MAAPSSKYDPNQYGQHQERIPEGVHRFVISMAETTYSNDGRERWAMILQPVDETYHKKNGYKVWLNVDGCVNAIYDAAGHDPKSVAMKEYTPEMFAGKVVSAEIIYAPDKKDPNKTWPNIKRLYPAFSLGGVKAPAKVDPVKAEPFPDYAFGDDEVQF